MLSLATRPVAVLRRRPATPAHAAPGHAAPSWNVDDVHWRACDLCRHGTTVGTQRMCTCPAVATPRQPMPVHHARHKHGPCGLEAEHLDFAGLHG